MAWPFLGFPVLLAAANKRAQSYPSLLPLLGILLAQVIMIWILDGSHSFAHQYYQLATAPTVCLRTAFSIHSTKNIWANFPAWRQFLMALCALGWISSFGDRVSFELRHLWSTSSKSSILRPDMCADLKRQLPTWPWDRGLCFGERTNAKLGRYGIYTSQHSLPNACEPVLKNSEEVLVECFDS